MMFVPMTRKLVLLPHLHMLRRLGAPVNRLLEASGLARAFEYDSSAVIPRAAACDFYVRAAHAVGSEESAWRALEDYDLVRLQTGVTALLKKFPTPAAAIPIVHTCATMIDSTLRSWVVQQGNRFWVCSDYNADAFPGRRVAIFHALVSGIQYVQTAAGKDWWPDTILLQSEPIPWISEIESLAKTKVCFRRPVNAFSVPVDVLSLPFRLDHIPCAEWDTRSTPSQELAESLRQFIRWRLTDGTPDIEEAADAVGTSVRSLQRELTTCGLSFSCMLDGIRFELARQGLLERGLKVIELALDLGFSDPANFTRAFRRWTGISPTEWRTVHARC